MMMDETWDKIRSSEYSCLPQCSTRSIHRSARACRGCWMRFFDALESIFYSSRKISDDLFLSVVKFHDNSLPGCPSCAASCPGNGIFLFIFAIYLHFFDKNWPQGGCPGPSHRPHPPSARH